MADAVPLFSGDREVAALCRIVAHIAANGPRCFPHREEAIETLMEEQRGKCGACRRKFPERSVRLDHCHRTGFVRGLLCHGCNIAEGKGYDRPGLRKYLDKPPARRRWVFVDSWGSFDPPHGATAEEVRAWIAKAEEACRG